MRNVIIAAICCALSVLAASPALSGHRILVVHSYHAGMPHIGPIHKGLLAALKGDAAEIEYFYMDAKRRTSVTWKKKAGELAKEKMALFQPQVVITVDDAAQEYFAKDFAGKTAPPQFIFMGVDGQADKYGFPAENVTGIISRPLFVQSVNLLLKIVPSAKKLAVVSSDSPSSRLIVNYLKSRQPPIEVTGYYLVADFSKWKEIINRVKGQVDALAIPVYHSLKRSPEDQSPVSPDEVMAWTLANSPKPILGFYDFVIADGALCGIVWSGETEGYRAGKIARAMLTKGKTAADFPVTTSENGKVMINLRSAQKLGITTPYNVIRLAQEVIK